jgi:aminoglycoside phosphotransferase family enzyme
MRGEPPLRSLVRELGRGHFADGGCLNQAKRVTTAEKVRFLASLEAYPGATGPVGVEETHMSWVFLVDERVYKLKKPVRYPFLDLSTLEARQANCRSEDRLNRRLAPDVYLGVVSLTAGVNDRLTIAGKGEIVDWLVKMRRLPADRMLDRAITTGTAARQEVNAVARRLFQFYLDAEPATIGGAEYVRQFAHEQAINREILTEHGFDLDRVGVGRALACVDEVLHGPAGTCSSGPRQAESSRAMAISARSTSVSCTLR